MGKERVKNTQLDGNRNTNQLRAVKAASQKLLRNVQQKSENIKRDFKGWVFSLNQNIFESRAKQRYEGC